MDKIICIGKNYFEHALELNDPVPENPVVFFKPPSALINIKDLNKNKECDLWWDLGAIHYECELVFRVSGGGAKLSEAQAQGCLKEVSIGLDLTLRDTQSALKKSGHPWEMSKAFYHSAIVGPFIPFENKFTDLEFSLMLNGELRQKSSASKMRFNPAFCLSYVSQFIPICDGDILFTGTPEGVGVIKKGDEITLSFHTLLEKVKF